MTDSWHSYPSTFQLGHKALTSLFDGPVLVEEKVDGSQFSFGVFWTPERAAVPDYGIIDAKDDLILALRCRSKGAQLNLIAPEKMFAPAIETARRLATTVGLNPGWTYRGEFLGKPKHNALAYARVPKDHVILFDVNPAQEDYVSWEDKAAEAERLGLEVVPRLFHGTITDLEMFRLLLDTVSVLGGQKIEGVVVKNYARFGLDKKVLIGKYVSEAFKEVHAAEWKAENPKSGDIVEILIRQYKTPARWAKAVQHLRDAGTLEHAPKDIGLLMREVPEDIAKDAEEDIKARLWAWAWPKVRRGVLAGLPEWYKDQLLASQFTAAGAESAATGAVEPPRP